MTLPNLKHCNLCNKYSRSCEKKGSSIKTCLLLTASAYPCYKLSYKHKSTTELLSCEILWNNDTRHACIDNSCVWQQYGIGIWRFFLPQDHGSHNLYAIATHTITTTNYKRLKNAIGVLFVYIPVLWNVNRENIKNAFAQLHVSRINNNKQDARYYVFHRSPTNYCTEIAIKMTNVLYFAADIRLYYMMSVNYMLTQFWCIARKTKRPQAKM